VFTKTVLKISIRSVCEDFGLLVDGGRKRYDGLRSVNVLAVRTLRASSIREPEMVGLYGSQRGRDRGSLTGVDTSFKGDSGCGLSVGSLGLSVIVRSLCSTALRSGVGPETFSCANPA
jgi:hypothetical protein